MVSCRTGIIAIVLSAAPAGRGSTGQPFVTDARLSNGLVIVLTGIHGRMWLSEGISKGLAKGGVDEAVEIYDWTYHGMLLPFYNLSATSATARSPPRWHGVSARTTRPIPAGR